MIFFYIKTTKKEDRKDKENLSLSLNTLNNDFKIFQNVLETKMIIFDKVMEYIKEFRSELKEFKKDFAEVKKVVNIVNDKCCFCNGQNIK